MRTMHALMITCTIAQAVLFLISKILRCCLKGQSHEKVGWIWLWDVSIDPNKELLQ
jgi:uncharacterized membrane protein HdeD (DUF308 family)